MGGWGLGRSGGHDREWAKARELANTCIQQPKCNVLADARQKSRTCQDFAGRGCTPKYNFGVRGTAGACLYREWTINCDLPFDCTNSLVPV